MNPKIIAVVKKEFFRFFYDKRMVFTTLIMPGLMIYVMYSFMGQGFMEQSNVDEKYASKIYMLNQPEFVETALKKMEIEYEKMELVSLDDMKEKVKNKEVDLLAVFPENFSEQFVAYDSQTSVEEAPQVALYFNSSRKESRNIYDIYDNLLNEYEKSYCNKFDINSGESKYDLASDKDTTGQIFSMMLPMLLMIFMFSGCMAIAPEAIAGEKERGTIATLLVTPTKRSHLAAGKIISLSILSLLSGASSFIGIIISMPKLMKGNEDIFNTAVYGVGDYLLMLLIIFSTVLIFVSVISIVSAFAKSVKEAATYISPLMIIVVILGISSMMGDGAVKESYMYLIPVYNSAQSLSSVFSFSYVLPNILITIGANFIVSLLLGVVLSRMFNSEKMMFN